MPIHSIWRCSNTFYTSNMDVGCSQWWFTASTSMTPHKKTRIKLQQTTWTSMLQTWSSFLSTEVEQRPGPWAAWHHNVIWDSPYPSFPKFGHHLHRYDSVRVHPCAHPQHMKVLKHFVCFQNGCGRQSVVAYSLNHDTTAHLGSTLPQFSKFGPHLHRYNSEMVHRYTHPQHIMALKYFMYMQIYVTWPIFFSDTCYYSVLSSLGNRSIAGSYRYCSWQL